MTQILCRETYHQEHRDYRSDGYNTQNVKSIEMGPSTSSKHNPFVEGSQLQQEAESVVHAFLMNEANKKSMQQRFSPDETDSSLHRFTQPGKIADLPSPTGPYGQMQVGSNS